MREESLLDKYRDINLYHEWWDCTYDHWREKLQQVGYDDVEMTFSGFCSQGDGASFTAKVRSPDVQLFMNQHDLATRYPHVYTLAGQGYVSLWLSRYSSHYYHENTVGGEGELETMYEPDDDADLREAAMWEIYCKAELEFPEFVEDFETISRDYMQHLYRDLESDYFHLTSDEAVRETLSINNIQ